MGKLTNQQYKVATMALLGVGAVTFAVVMFWRQYGKEDQLKKWANKILKKDKVENEKLEKYGEQPAAYGGNVSQNGVDKDEEMDPSQLLPKHITEQAQQWGDLSVPNKDSGNYLIGGPQINENTQGGSLKNPNLQIRPDPIIPKQDVSIWNNSDIQPDLYRRPLL